MKNSKAALFGTLSLAAVLLAGPALSQDVRIIAKDGSIDITGNLLSAEGGQLRLATPIGEITVDQTLVICEGAACPQVKEYEFAFGLSGPAEVTEALVPLLFDGFAARDGAEAVFLDETGAPIGEDGLARAIRPGAMLPLQLRNEDGKEIVTVGVREAAGAEAFELLASGQVALAFSDVAPGPSDIRKVESAGGGDLASYEQEMLVTMEGLTVIGHPGNTLPSITVKALAGVLSGEIGNWAELGGADAPINLYTLAADADGTDDIAALILKPRDLVLSPAAKVVGSVKDLAAAVTEDPLGIAVIGYQSRRGTRAIPIADECGMVVAASPFTIKNGEYPLVRPVNAYVHAGAGDLAAEVFRYLDSPNLDRLVAKSGFIDLSVVPESDDYAAARLEALRTMAVEPAARPGREALLPELEGVRRLSTTFRFAPKSSILDNRARRDLSRLVHYIGKTKPATVYVVGFADRGGSFAVNQKLSQQRAEQVAAEIAAAATGGELEGVSVEVRAYSELLPVACNDTFDGRSVNRRVEIWVR